MDISKKHRIGILVKNLEQKNFNGELICSLLSNENIEIDTILVNTEGNNKNKILDIAKKYSFKRIFEKILFKFLIFFEKLIFNISNSNINFKKINLETLESKKIYLKPNIDTIKNIYTYSDNDIKKIVDRNLDALIRLESGIIKGKLLDSTKKGILSFHHADSDLYRGLPPGFWEVYFKNATTGFVIQKINEQLDGGELIFKGNTITKPYFFLNQQFVFKQSIKYLNNTLNDYLSNNNFKFLDKEPYKSKIYKEPKFKELFSYIFNTYFFILKKIYFKFAGFKEIWNICYTAQKFKKENLQNYKIINNHKKRFFADPFVVKFKDLNYIFVEDYSFKNRRGQISCFEINNNEEKFLGCVLSENFHLSFPFVFKFNDEFFMCPETKEKKEIRIYKCKKFPNEWAYFKTLINKINAVDTIIFEKNNIWWLITNTDKNNLEFSSELSIFYSEDGPLTTNWKAHKNNPVIVNANKARNAGFYNDGKNIFRVSQRIGFNTYGTGFDINTINDISKNSYTEILKEKINCNFFEDSIGTHHLTSIENFSAIDIKRFSNQS
ncbi:MAG: hypothetical protein CL687_02860 [Candidatus Pelagibacter sp.]|nr:hypothetical protein [Candidatus Pelagibacter sp.]MAJ85893.1 hypothetical protein [Candidatus Pelagibacter sp.]OUW24227.1 MAG: hypothetical protein CBD34_01210 [Rickettsiales bacterium TMED174]|tara:strand:+ start:907 stop:2562 length:1656 start_codon:yes stop_codon:yes gene_type:complete